MRTFVNDFVATLGFKGQKRAGFLLEEAKVDRVAIDNLANKVSSQGIFGNLVLAKMRQGGRISGNQLAGEFRDAHIRVKELFGLSNNLSTILSNNINILTSDVKALEDELTALEKATFNYAFLLSDGGAYDYAFLEPFSDNKNRETDFDFILSDRANQFFAADEAASLITDEGVIVLPQNVAHTFHMFGTVLENNCFPFATSLGDINDSLVTASEKGWRVAVATKSPLNATLNSFRNLYPDTSEYSGVNIVVDLVLDTPSPCDNFKITPFSDAPFTLVQAEVYPNIHDQSKKINLLQNPIDIDSTRNFFFKLQPIAKIKLYIQQNQYTRNSRSAIPSEEEFRRLRDSISNGSTLGPLTTGQDDARIGRINRLPLSWPNSNETTSVLFGKTMPGIFFTPQWGSGSEEWFLKKRSTNSDVGSSWTNQTIASTLVDKFLRARLPLDSLKNFIPDTVQQDRSGLAGNLPNQPGTSPITTAPAHLNNIVNIESSSFLYEYNIGIHTFEIGNGLSGFKGAFVSKEIPSPGDVGEVKIKVAETQYIETLTDKDQPRCTSTEYSVTNKSRPETEADWLPIMPADITSVIAERFFVDAIGKGYFRFPASLKDDVQLYKDGHSVRDINIKQYFIMSSNKQTVIGIKLPTGYATSQDVFTVDYIPAQDFSTINFEKSGFNFPPLASSFDEAGAGEGFNNTGGQFTITLKYEPFVDYSKIALSPYTALGHSGYNPITIRFDDGSIAYNFTNYSGGAQNVLDGSSDNYQYIQNGNVLLFNKVVDIQFRVFYQYLPNNLRIRTVLRCNTKDLVTPKVDYVQVKAKTRQADPKRN